MDETILRYGIVVNPPGERYQYANLDYGIAEHIIERVSGRPYDAFMDTHVFAPLGLTRTYVLVPPHVRPGTVTGYDWQRRVPYFDFDQRGAGAVFSSMHDLARFGMIHLKNRSADHRQILTDAALEAMRRPEALVPGDDPGVNYALGWATRDNQFGYRVDSHNGGQQGGSADLRLVPAKNIVVAVASNTQHSLTYSIGGDILAALLPDYKARWQQRDTSPPPPPPPFRPAQELLGEWQGEIVTWQKALPITLTFQPDGDVHVRLADQLVTLLDKVSYTDGNFSGTFNGALPPPDIARHPHRLQLMNLRIRDGVMGGAVIAIDTTARWDYGLPSWISLKRK